MKKEKKSLSLWGKKFFQNFKPAEKDYSAAINEALKNLNKTAVKI